MPFLRPNQQRQSTEGIGHIARTENLVVFQAISFCRHAYLYSMLILQLQALVAEIGLGRR